MRLFYSLCFLLCLFFLSLYRLARFPLLRIFKINASTFICKVNSEKMNSMTKPRVICIPLPVQGHINPMLKLAKLPHFKGFCITFVHTEFNVWHLVSSLDDLQSSNDFRFETISDGLPPTNKRGILDLPELVTKIQVDGQRSFKDLVTKLNHASSSDHDVHAVSCIISDGVMGFT